MFGVPCDATLRKNLRDSDNSSRIHLADDAIELDEDHLERPILCSLLPRCTILNISLVGGGSHPILCQYHERGRHSRILTGERQGLVVAVDDDANEPQPPPPRRLAE